MSCTSCGMPPTSVETYENFPWLNANPEQSVEKKTESDCKQQSKCFYTAQGLFVCDAAQTDNKNVSKNEEMAKWSLFNQKGLNKSASPFLS